ncbi:MAG: hypothetical protein ACK5AZ_11035 [Bryobacteraceae bacterium]
MRRLLLLAALPLLAWIAQAASTATWELNNYQDFLRGRFQGVSLTRDGRLMLAPDTETVFSSGQPAIWSAAQAPDGSVYLGTGHRGRLYRVDSSGKSTLVWTADEPEIFAVAVDKKGVVYAATSPGGKIYCIQNGAATEYFSPGARYIWALAFGQDGALYAGTGDQGQVFRITSAGQGEVYYETGQMHVTALAIDAHGRVLAGTDPNGILYRITAKDKAFVLYDANLPEIRAIVPAADGSIYAAALGGSVAKRTAAAAAAPSGQQGNVSVSSTVTSITVTDEMQAGLDLKPRGDQQAKTSDAAVQAQALAAFSPVLNLTGIEKSAVYRIHPDNTVETLWSSKEENAYDLLESQGEVTFSTDDQGRIYRLSPDRKVTLLLQTEEGEATRLIPTSKGLLATTVNMGKVIRIVDGAGSTGTYESPVHDAGSVARWGRLQWRAAAGSRGKLTFQTRSGNSARPDRTWSAWSEALADPDGSSITSPNARYIQWRASFDGGGGQSPVLEGVSVAYLPQNNAPVVRAITVSSQAASNLANKPASNSSASVAPYSITVTDTGEVGAATSGGTPTQTLNRSVTEQMNISWQADDPDGDRLLFSLYFRGEGERKWKLLKEAFPENTYLLDSDVLADGRYFFRVVASDRAANPADSAREAELVSAPVLIDNTPPVVTTGSPRRSGSTLELDVTATDATSALRRCEYSVDAGTWTPVEAEDGVTDSKSERFRIRAERLSPGEHLIVIRVFDGAGNAGLAKVVVE